MSCAVGIPTPFAPCRSAAWEEFNLKLIEANKRAASLLREATMLREAAIVAENIAPERFYFPTEMDLVMGSGNDDAKIVAKHAIIAAFTARAKGLEETACEMLLGALAPQDECKPAEAALA
jgi:hypothetical protein